MHIRFDLDFDGDPWPGPLHARDAAAGEAWVGPLGLLGQLETALGLGGRHASQTTRVAAVVASLAKHDGFWRRSAEADPLGVARTLLGWRDMLRLAGWDGGPVGVPRIDQLASLTAGLPMGIGDRLEAVEKRLQTRGTHIEQIDVLARPTELAARWRSVLEKLRMHGTRVGAWTLTPALAAVESRVHAEQPPVRERMAVARRRSRALRFSSGEQPAARDLLRCGAAGFVPSGDGSLQLVRPEGPLEAADEVAAWLAAQARIDDVVIVGADAVLDGALRRHGLPVTGAGGELRHSALFQVLPLALEVALQPCDPQRMLEFLLLPATPIEPQLARRLADALHQWPAVDSDAWRTVCREHATAVAARSSGGGEWNAGDGGRSSGGDAGNDERSGDGGGARSEEDGGRWDAGRTSLLRPSVARDGDFPLAEAIDRVAVVETWLRTLGDAPVARAAVEQCGLLAASLRAAERSFWDGDSAGRSPDATMPLLQLRRLLAETAEAVSDRSPMVREAGLHAVRTAGAVAGPVARVVWWNFTRDAIDDVARVPFTAAERAALAAAGVALPDASELALARAARWRRPLQQALTSVLFVAPRRGARGDEQFIHPLWDEVCSNLAESRDAARLEARVPGQAVAATRVTRARRPLPAALHGWRATLPPMRPVESPSSLATLVSCSMQYALRYFGRLQPGRTAPLPEANQLLGRVAHEMMAAVFADGPMAPDVALLRARAWLQSEAPRLAATLFLPENHALLGSAVRVMTEAARDFAALLDGRPAEAIEQALRSTEEGYVLEGRPDMRVGGGVIDFKWGGGAHYAAALRAGSASQLASYARLAGQEAVAYYVLRERRLLQSGPLLGDGGVVAGPPMSAVWRGFETAIAARRAELSEGRIFAEGLAPEVVAHGGLDGARLRLPPSCNFCDYDRLCGVRRG